MDVSTPEQELEEIAITHFPHNDRLAYTIKMIPGIPKQNQKLENLVQVKIPWLEIDSKDEIIDLIANTVQIDKAKDIYQLETNTLFPISGDWLSTADLMELYRVVDIGSNEPIIDEERLTLSTAPQKQSTFQKIKDWIK